jgi:predicted PurR-regulated permease PerM
VPYGASILWLLLLGQAWIAQVLLAPLLMAVLLGALTWWLAQREFRG